MLIIRIIIRAKKS